ncbi:hypothetical protein GCM10009734_14770 [Nonomuraea bangladeshensis]
MRAQGVGRAETPIIRMTTVGGGGPATTDAGDGTAAAQTITSSRDVLLSRSPPLSVHTTMSSMRAPCRPAR